uniref:Cilia- and flagella-associated protein 91 n=1 Tax=Gadus morhua TaxID=8049 RepID=A0A8C5D1I5_GADMO
MSLSVTRTASVKHRSAKGFRPQRAYDYLYDPVHTVSGEADHARSSFKAYASADRLRRVQDFDSMFSSNPRFALQLSAVDPVPPSMDRRWPGAMERHRHTEQALDGPLIAFDRPPPPDLLLALFPSLSRVQQNAPTGPYHRTVGVQTDYRDSEAQTDPYSPEYVVRPGTAHPELLLLASLTWGGGLPAGLAEVEMIERARARRLWEAGLPPVEDLEQLERRRAMMEAMETREWAFREGEIQRLQEARLAALRDLLHQRAQEQTQATAQRQDLNLTRHQSHKEGKLRQIHGDYILSLRKLTAKRANVEGRLERRDVVRDHTDHASQAYAPLTRGGSVPDRVHSRSVGGVSSRFLDTYQGLLELEASLPASVLEPRIQAPGPRASRGFVGRAERREMELTQTHEALRAEKDRVEVIKPLRFLVKKERPAPQRPPTPSGEEEREVAAIVLQKLLRGRSIQYQMFAGKEKNLALIQEVRTTHALLGEEQRLLRTQTALVLGQQSQRDQQSQQEAEAAASRDGLVGAELVELLDSLAKELIRLQEERRIHAMALLAERERRLREAEESGRRQVEERRRREQDEIFRQVVQVQQATVELYLEDIILGVVESTAGQQARDEVQRMAREVNDVAHALEESHSEQQAEELVSALVFSFLIPEVQRISVRQKGPDSNPPLLTQHTGSPRGLSLGPDQ